MKVLRILAEVMILLLFVIVPPALAGYNGGGGGAALTAANTWVGTQTFTTAKFLDSNGSHSITMEFGDESANRRLICPTLNTDSEMITQHATQLLPGAKTFVDFKITDTTDYVESISFAGGNQTGNRTITYPTLSGNGKARIATATSSGTATLVAGTVTVSNATITANSLIHLTAQDESGTAGSLGVSARSNGVSFTIKSYQGDGTAQTADTRKVFWTVEEP